MNKEKIKEMLKEAAFLTSEERVFLTKKLIKWNASDMRVQANAIDNLASQLDSAGDRINRLRIELADIKAKEALSTLKYAERKLKENGGLAVSWNESESRDAHAWNRDDEGFNILKEAGRAAAKNIDKMIIKEP
jgi:hypothetical protein